MHSHILAHASFGHFILIKFIWVFIPGIIFGLFRNINVDLLYLLMLLGRVSITIGLYLDLIILNRFFRNRFGHITNFKLIVIFFMRNDNTLYCIILDKKIVDSRSIIAITVSRNVTLGELEAFIYVNKLVNTGFQL